MYQLTASSWQSCAHCRLHLGRTHWPKPITSTRLLDVKSAALRKCRNYASQNTQVRASKGFGGAKPSSKQKAPTEKKVDEATSAKKQKRFQQNFKNSALAWDDTFASICKDPSAAALLWNGAEEGYRTYGRGCLFVRAEVHDRFSGSKRISSKALASATPLITNPDLLVTSLEIDYIPLSLLRPQSITNPDASTMGIPLPSLENLMADSAGASNPQSASAHVGADSGSPDAGGEIIDIDLYEGAVAEEVLDQLRRAMRGMDASRTINLVGGGNVDIGGERCYQPSNNEAVILLATRVDAMPLIGADIVAKQAEADGSINLIFPDAVTA